MAARTINPAVSSVFSLQGCSPAHGEEDLHCDSNLKSSSLWCSSVPNSLEVVEVSSSIVGVEVWEVVAN